MKSLEEKLLAAFEVEHRDHLEAARTMLGAALAGVAPDLVELHRRLHSLKGAARAVDMRPVEALAHALEGLIEDCQRGAFGLDAETVDAMRGALDAIEDWVAASLAREQPPAIDAIVESIRSRRPASTEPINRTGESPPGDEPAIPEPAIPEPARAATTRVETRDFDAVLQSASEILTALSFQNSFEEDLHAIGREAKGLEHELAARRRAGAESAGFEARRAGGPAARLQKIIRGLDAAKRQQRAQAWRLRQLGRRLQSQVELLRMVSADTVFAGVGKIVRDIARDQGKRVRVTVKGLETIADKAVLQSLKDPALHILRNAINHGIETPEARRRRGKAGEGVIHFEIGAHAGELRLVVEDDGAGIDVGRVAAAAKERGLAFASADAPALTAILTQPGFSTAERVTEVAGRGMGLSVVKEAVARLGGSVAITPRDPCGVRVALAAPLSALATRFVIASVAGETWCLPASRLERIHRVRAEDIETLEGRAHVVKEGRAPMAIAPLAFLLGDSGAMLQLADGMLTLIELRGDLKVAVVVDEIIGVRDGVMRDFGKEAHATDLVAGGVLLDAGIVAPVLDASALAAAYRGAGAACAVAPKSAEAGARRRSILVVDDSITTRTLERSILEANGFEVRLSVDGADALRQLRQRTSDLVISDVEMPSLDGFGLVRAIKQDAELCKIPVILVTSRSNDGDRRRGLDLGADAYVVKQRFDQADLLSIIDRLI